MIDIFLIKTEDVAATREALISNEVVCGMCVIDGKQGKSLVKMESDSGNTLAGWGFPVTADNEPLTEEEYDAYLSEGDF